MSPETAKKPTAADLLDDLLHTLAKRGKDPRTRRWAAALIEGDKAENRLPARQTPDAKQLSDRPQ